MSRETKREKEQEEKKKKNKRGGTSIPGSIKKKERLFKRSLILKD